MPQNKVTLEPLNPPVNTTSPAIPALRKRTAPLSIALLLTILGILLLRIASIGSMPLVDPSESRYALVAKLMDSSGNYLVPHFVDHEGTTRPFWAKPPLFFWANALSNQLFGSSDASARLPSLLAAIGTILLVGVFTQAVRMRRLKMIAMLFTASSGVFFAYAGLCQMDMLLTFTTALALCSFALWHQSPKHKGLWSTIFSASLACGLLTKGPVVVALVVITITLPTLYRLLRASRLRPIAATKLYLRLKKARGKRSLFPFGKTLLLSALLVTPWFLFAEQQSPGLTRYFLLHENFLRFVSRDYGDLYGSAHRYPYGTIWVFLLLASLPWGLILLLKPKLVYRAVFSNSLNKWQLFALSWGISPAVLFCFSRNLLPSYALPGIPGLAIFGCLVINNSPELSRYCRSNLASFRSLFCISAIISFVVYASHIEWLTRTDYQLTLLCMNIGLMSVLLLTITIPASRAWSDSQRAASLFGCAGIALYMLQTSVGAVVGETVPASTYAPEIELRYPSADFELNFPYGIPYSAHLYLDHDLESDLTELRSEDLDHDEVVVVPLKNRSIFEALKTDPGVSYTKMARLGDWLVYERANK